MTAKAVQIVQKLTASQIVARREALAEEDRTLRILLRAARARERAKRMAAEESRRGR